MFCSKCDAEFFDDKELINHFITEHKVIHRNEKRFEAADETDTNTVLDATTSNPNPTPTPVVYTPTSNPNPTPVVSNPSPTTHIRKEVTLKRLFKTMKRNHTDKCLLSVDGKLPLPTTYLI